MASTVASHPCTLASCAAFTEAQIGAYQSCPAIYAFEKLSMQPTIIFFFILFLYDSVVKYTLCQKLNGIL